MAPSPSAMAGGVEAGVAIVIVRRLRWRQRKFGRGGP